MSVHTPCISALIQCWYLSWYLCSPPRAPKHYRIPCWDNTGVWPSAPVMLCVCILLRVKGFIYATPTLERDPFVGGAGIGNDPFRFTRVLLRRQARCIRPRRSAPWRLRCRAIAWR
jgi:hypothetical protein